MVSGRACHACSNEHDFGVPFARTRARIRAKISTDSFDNSVDYPALRPLLGPPIGRCEQSTSNACRNDATGSRLTVLTAKAPENHIAFSPGWNPASGGDAPQRRVNPHPFQALDFPETAPESVWARLP